MGIRKWSAREMRFASLLVIASLAAAVALPIGDGEGVALLDIAKKDVDSADLDQERKLSVEEARAEAQEKKNLKTINKMEKDESKQADVTKELKAVQKEAKQAAKLSQGSDSFKQLLGDNTPTAVMKRLAKLTSTLPPKVDSDNANQAAVLSLGEEGHAPSASTEEEKLTQEEVKAEANSKKAEKTIKDIEDSKKKVAEMKKKMKAVQQMAKSAKGKDSLGEAKKEDEEEAKLTAEAKKVKANAKKNEAAIDRMEADIQKKKNLKKQMNSFKSSVKSASKMSGSVVQNALGDDTPEVVMERLQRLATEEEQNEVTKTSHAVNDFANSATKTIDSIH